MIIGIYSSAPRSGKSTVGKFLEAYGFERLSFGEAVKQNLLEFMNAVGVVGSESYLWGNKKETVIPELGLTGGQLMSNYAMNKRYIDPDYWLRIIQAKYDGANYYIDDLRFDNEREWIGKHGLTLKVVRHGATNTRKSDSEGQLKGWTDHYIRNDGTLEELKQHVNDFATYGLGLIQL